MAPFKSLFIDDSVLITTPAGCLIAVAAPSSCADEKRMPMANKKQEVQSLDLSSSSLDSSFHLNSSIELTPSCTAHAENFESEMNRITKCAKEISKKPHVRLLRLKENTDELAQIIEELEANSV